MKRFRKVLIVLLAILVPVSIGFGFNFFSWNKSQELSKEAMTVDGALTITDVANVKNLVPGDKICDGVTMDIKSSAVSLLRVKVDVYYAEANSENYTVTTDIEPIKNAGDNWLKGSDGYYYYTQGVKNNTVSLASGGIYFNAADNKDENININMNKYQGKKIKVKAEAELVQAKYGVFAKKWDLNETDDGDIYTKLKQISDDQEKSDAQGQ
ncbi:MAG: hypothetical protein KH083_09200 [Intestinibacter bartlettii]|uniref:hypothetical protein n=1 Tax=Intestinibacter bartlettii TaxID=261299 RepID=UPI00242D7A6C|nr:hypothetical protein [Intestinibacter bartlettii]MBS7148577.1 hypothetical protein [Intestinibacter bartlettii]